MNSNWLGWTYWKAAGIERAGEPGERGAEGERPQLGADQIDAHAGGGELILADRLPGAAEPGVVERG